MSAPAVPFSPDLLPAVLAVSLTAIHVVRPLYGPDGTTIVDFALEYVSPAGQRMTGLAEHPGGTILSRYPSTATAGVFDYYQRAFAAAGEVLTYGVNYQADGLDAYFRFAAQRSGDVLVISFTDTADQDRSAVEQALRESQAREQAAYAQAERERGLLQALLTQAPVAIGLFQGEELRIAAANAQMAAAWGRTPEQVLGQPLLAALPEIKGQGFDDLLRQVVATQVPVTGTETPATMLRDGELQTTYYNFVYQPLYDANGAVLGVIDVSVEVTEQVRARQQVEKLNQELEARVQERTRQLTEQQQLLSRILGQVPAAIGTLSGPEHRFTFANDLYHRMVGRQQSVVGLPVAEALPEVVDQGFVGLLDRVRATGEPFIGQEIPIQLLDEATGDLRQQYLNFVYQPLANVPGHEPDILVFAVDVTEQVQTRQQVELLNRELEARVQAQTAEALVARAEAERQRGELERVFEQAPIAIAVYRGPNYVIELANSTVARLWGRTQEQLIGKGLFEALPEVAGMGYEELLDGVMATGIPSVTHGMEARHERNGRLETVFWDFVYVPMYEADGSIYGAMVVATEVTEQVLARRKVEQLNQELESRVQERTRQLTEQQGLLSQILRLVPAAIATLGGPEHRYTFFNEPYQELSAHRTVLGQTVAEVFPEVVAQGFVGLLDNVYATGEPFVGVDTPAQLYNAATGRPEQYYIDFLYQPLFDGHRQVQGILAFILDVTDKVAARQQVQNLNEELAAINEELQVSNENLHDTNTQLTHVNVDLDSFIYTASHDLRAPITNIEGLLEILALELPNPLPDELRDVLAMMHESVTRFKRTLANLSDVVRLQKEHNQPVAEVSLAEVTDDVLLDLQPLLRASNARIDVDVADCPTVSFSPKNLRSVVYNLLSNAVKYRHPDRAPHVHLSCRQEAKYTVLTVRDNGLGLDAAQQAQLFTMFRRLHKHVEGTGVGLYMIKRNIENAGGRIEVASEPGVGSTFTVYFRR